MATDRPRDTEIVIFTCAGAAQPSAASQDCRRAERGIGSGPRGRSACGRVPAPRRVGMSSSIRAATSACPRADASIVAQRSVSRAKPNPQGVVRRRPRGLRRRGQRWAGVDKRTRGHDELSGCGSPATGSPPRTTGGGVSGFAPLDGPSSAVVSLADRYAVIVLGREAVGESDEPERGQSSVAVLCNGSKGEDGRPAHRRASELIERIASGTLGRRASRTNGLVESRRHARREGRGA
jgi:hypothetical protein